MKAVERTTAKLRSCVASCRGAMFERPSMVMVLGGDFGSGRLGAGERAEQMICPARTYILGREGSVGRV
jgi:hypothetical protein